MSTTYLDAEAQAVRAGTVRAAARFGAKTYVVGRAWVRVPPHPLVERVLVGDERQGAQHWIAERAGRGDVVVTDDLLLVFRCLAAGSQVLAPSGRPWTLAALGDDLATRDIMREIQSDAQIKAQRPKNRRASFGLPVTLGGLFGARRRS